MIPLLNSIFILHPPPPLPSLSEVRYLGLYLDRQLTWNAHTHKAEPRWNDDFRYLNNSKTLGQNVLYTINLQFITIIKPIWTYGVEISFPIFLPLKCNDYALSFHKPFKHTVLVTVLVIICVWDALLSNANGHGEPNGLLDNLIKLN